MNKPAREQSPLAPYRVLDLADESGVFCTKMLGALGADVIKVERPGGDPARRIGPFYRDQVHPERSLHWYTYNLNKRSITLNIECKTGQELFMRLVKTADFVVETFRPGYLESLGLGYSDLSSVNPRIVHTSITPFGATGPYSQFKGSNLVCSAASGYMYLCGDEDRAPVEITTPIAYVQTGLHAAAGTMMAHWYRQRTGEGQHIDVSVRESMETQILPHPYIYKVRHIIAHRGKMGTVVPGNASHLAIFECKDGYVVSGTTISTGRKALRDWLASEGMAGDLFDQKYDKVFNEGAPVTTEQKDHIDGLFQAFARKHTREELMFQAQRRKIQVTKLHDVRDVVEDRHLKERGYFVKVDHPELGEAITYQGSPFKSSEMSWQYWRRAPFIGEHNKEVYAGELKLNSREMVLLKEGGVI